MAGNTIKILIEPTEEGATGIKFSDFLHALDAVRASLRTTANSLGVASQIDWRIKDISHSSPFTVELESGAVDKSTEIGSRQTVDTFFDFMDELSLHGRAPDRMNRATLEAFKRLANKQRLARCKITIANGSRSVRVSGLVESAADVNLAPATKTIGSIEGRLEYVNLHGQTNVYRIYPPVGPERVSCFFSNDELESKARAGLDHNIRLYGELTYAARAPFPKSIKVEDVVVLPKKEGAPDFLGLRGVAPNASGELSSEDFVSDLRKDD